jgi:hypothetical protein
MKFIDIPFKPAFVNEGPPFDTSGINALLKLDNGIKVSIVMHTGSYGGDRGLYELMITDQADNGLGGIIEGVQDDGIIGYLTPHDVETAINKLEEIEIPNGTGNIVPLRKEPHDA